MITWPTRAELGGLGPADLVGRATTHDGAWKRVYDEIERRAPADAVAQVVTDRFSEGSMPPWLAGALLQACRSRQAAPVALAILEAGTGSLSESYAAHALVRAIGRDAEPDFLRLLLHAAKAPVRFAAASGLVALDLPTSVDAILSAVDSGRLRPREAAMCLVGWPFSETELRDHLRATPLRQCFALNLVSDRIHRSEGVSSALAGDVSIAVSDKTLPLARRSREVLARWLEGQASNSA